MTMNQKRINFSLKLRFKFLDSNGVAKNAKQNIRISHSGDV